MKILVIADEESRSLWDYYDRSKLAGVDLILSCGDLKAAYLEFLVTMTSAEVIYVHGNHDHAYQSKAPEGCICAEDNIVTFQNLRILGLGGSMRYQHGAPFQYTEKEMQRRIRRCQYIIRRYRGFDILLTHSPSAGINDLEDLPHLGFQCFRDLLDTHHPAYHIHGHTHKNYGSFQRVRQYGQTTVINAFEKYIFEYHPVPKEMPPETLP